MCLNLPFEIKNQLTFYKVRWFKYTFFERVKIGKKWRKMLSPTYSPKFKNIDLFLNRGLIFFSNGHIHNFVSTLPNVVKIDVENDNLVSMMSNIVQFNVEKHSVVSILFYVVNFNVDTHSCFNVDLTLCDAATSYQPKSNVGPTLKCLLWNLLQKRSMGANFW